MSTLIFIVSLTAGVALVTLSSATLLWPRLQFWPPPAKDSWQYLTFWWLFRTMFAGLLILSFLDFSSLGPGERWRFLIGVPLAVLGFGLALHITFHMGWRAAHGDGGQLKTDGWYQWSRNPVYVVSILGMIGAGIVIHSTYVYCLLSIWALMYLLAPYLEEPWLEARYGRPYLEYKAQVPRFFGLK